MLRWQVFFYSPSIHCLLWFGQQFIALQYIVYCVLISSLCLNTPSSCNRCGHCFPQSYRISSETCPVDSLTETIGNGRNMQTEQPRLFSQRQLTAFACAYHAAEKLKWECTCCYTAEECPQKVCHHCRVWGWTVLVGDGRYGTVHKYLPGFSFFFHQYMFAFWKFFHWWFCHASLILSCFVMLHIQYSTTGMFCVQGIHFYPQATHQMSEWFSISIHFSRMTSKFRCLA